MSDRPLKDERAAQPAATAPAADAAGRVIPSLIIAAVSFLIVLGMIAGIWVMTSRRPAAAATQGRAADRRASVPGTEVVTLLDNNYFVTPLPPTGDRSITYQYTIAVKVAKSRRALLDDLLAPDRRNMLSAIREQVRKIIASEDYLKLRAEQLDGVKRHIRYYLNGLLSGEVVEDVIFDKWNVIS